MREGWKRVKLNDITCKCKNIKWKDVSEEKEYYYIDLSSVDRETKQIEDFQTINSLEAPSRAKQIIKRGDILFATTRPTLKRFCVVGSEYDEQICSTGFCVLRPNSEVLPKFIYYVLFSDNFYEYIEPLQTGASYPAVTDSVVKNYDLFLPSLSEQQRIVEMLDAEFAKIDAIKANAEKQLQWAKDLLNKSISELTSFQLGWNKTKLKELCSIKGEYGLNESATTFNGIRYLRITDITADGELNDEKVSAENKEGKSQKKLEPGDILFARTGATVGKTLVYKEEFGDCNFAGYLIRYRTNPSIILPQYLFYYTHSSRYYEWVIENQAAAAQPNISAQKYNELEIDFPKDIEAQQTIVEKLDTLLEKVKQLQLNYEKTIALCNDLKQSLLKDIFG